ncbi:MAG: TRAP transporter large permease subunit [Spirochaetales bacterium]|nr:TRAP transporter large permease subunit [Leptospiraceae bacterium]MCP5483422.1 TRAP transporter large permease subunit [Spirochaetales bacterium]MCP5486783.1 TRAP transporter large permease subunit [Spirochaetales bacterium]
MTEIFALLLFVFAVGVLLSGYPVALSLGGSALLFALVGALFGVFDLSLFGALPQRLFGNVMSQDTLIAIPLFIFMGVVLERSRIAEELLETMALLCGGMRGGLAISVFLVGALLAASTGIVGATVVTMGLISLPAMLKYRYQPEIATGIITASGTLGQIIPPSIILIILGDQISTAYQQALRDMGDFSGGSVSVGDLFMGALIPGCLLVLLYILYVGGLALFRGQHLPAMPIEERRRYSAHDLFRKTLRALIPPILLIVGVLGSIVAGVATPTEAASVGCVGGLALALLRGQFDLKVLRDVMRNTARVNSMVFLILIGASLFSLVFRGFDGDLMVEEFLTNLPGGKWSAFLFVMLLVFVLGFFLDFFEITFVVVPIVGPILLAMGLDPIWLGVMIALNLQTSFLTPPFGFALFYLRGVAPPSIRTGQIYRGAIPFICIQVLMLLILAFFPDLATYLPHAIYGE